MAESVDALVSNTSGVTSIPVRPRVWVLYKDLNILIIKYLSPFLFYICFPLILLNGLTYNAYLKFDTYAFPEYNNIY